MIKSVITTFRIRTNTNIIHSRIQRVLIHQNWILSFHAYRTFSLVLLRDVTNILELVKTAPHDPHFLPLDFLPNGVLHRPQTACNSLLVVFALFRFFLCSFSHFGQLNRFLSPITLQLFQSPCLVHQPSTMRTALLLRFV